MLEELWELQLFEGKLSDLCMWLPSLLPFVSVLVSTPAVTPRFPTVLAIPVLSPCFKISLPERLQFYWFCE